MKKLLLILLSTIVFSSLVNAQASTIPSTDIVIESISFTPRNIQPGSSFDLTIEVRNSNQERALLNPRFSVQESYPFTLDESEPLFKSVDRLEPNERIQYTFKINVDPSARDSGNLRLAYQAGGLSAKYLSNPINIEFLTSTLDLDISRVRTTPERVVPGSEVEITLTLRNTATSIMNDISVNLDLSGSGIPFVPLGSTTERKLSTLPPGSSTDLAFNVIVDADAEPKAYKIPLTIQFTDEFGEENTIETTTGLKIDSEIELLFSLEESEIIQKNTRGNVMVRVTNIGSSDAKFITLYLRDSDNYEIISTKEVYLGNVEPDDYETAEFTIFAKNTVDNQVPLILMVKYKDTYNEKFDQMITVNVPTYSIKSAQRYGLLQGGNQLKHLIYIFLIVFAYFVFKEWRKLHDLGKAVRSTIYKTLVLIKRIIKSIRPRTVKIGIKKVTKFFKEP